MGKNSPLAKHKARRDNQGEPSKSKEKKRVPQTRYRLKPHIPPRLPRIKMPWWLRLLNWREVPWWGRLLIVLGGIGVGLAIWFAVQSTMAPPPEYRLVITESPAGSGQVNISPRYKDYHKGTQVILEATPSAEYEFASWSGDVEGLSPTVTVTMDSNKAVTANFRIVQYGLTANVSPPEGGQVSPSAGSYDSISQVVLEATPAAEYEFVSWSGDVQGAVPTVTITMDSDKEVTANFRIIRYDLTTVVSPPEGGRVSPSAGIYNTGSKVILEAIPSAEYGFVYWSGDVRGTDPVVTLEIDSDKEVTANFTRIIQEINVVMPIGISASVDTFSNVIDSGETIEGFVEITGDYKSYDRDFAWTFEIFSPEGRRIAYKRGHWLRDNHYDFSCKAPYSGSYKIIVRHNSLYEKELLIEIRPMGWQ